MFFKQQATQSTEITSSGRLPALDGVRGLAVLFVLLDHASDAEMRLFPGADLNRLGKYGVYLFFVLSAFLLTHQLHRRPAEELVQSKTWLDYAFRRFMRIFPLYAIVLVAMVAMEKLALGDIGTHLLLQDGKRVFWTIAVEVKFYLILPLLVLAFLWAGRKQWWLGVLGGVLASAVIAVFLALEQMWSLHENVLLAPNLAPFLMGAAAAVAYGHLQKALSNQRWATWFEIAAIAALLGVLVRVPAIYNILFPHDPVGKLANDAAICGVLWSVVILGTLHGRGWLASVFNWRPLGYLGLISFSAYLWHLKFLTDVDDLPVPSFFRLLAFLGIVIAVSSVSYFLIERPLLRLRRRSTKPQATVLGNAAATVPAAP